MQATARQPEPRPGLLLAAQSPPGRVWIAVFAGAALYPGFGYLAAAFTAAIGLAAFRPAWRRSIVSTLAILVCASGFVPRQVAEFSSLTANSLSSSTALAAALWLGAILVWTRFAKRLPHAIARRSGLLLHALAAALIAGLWLAGARGILTPLMAATICGLVPELLWRSAYWIKWRLRQGDRAPVWGNLFAVLPFLGAGGVPIGKGPTYFAAHEASDREQLASSQVEGVRLLMLALVWRFADEALSALLWGRASTWTPGWMVNAHPAVPAMDALLRRPDLATLPLRWAGLYGELFHTLLTLGVFSHTIVGAFCLLGFHIPRNMKSPLLATTILDFWGRYFYYFKELLMDFWFFPAYLRSRLPMPWRTALSIASAAFAGNLYYHVALYWPLLAAGYGNAFLSRLSARVIYCALLTAGLCGSFARSLGKTRSASAAALPRRVFQAVLVSAFFAVIHVWNYVAVGVTVQNRWELWKSLLAWTK
jgi:hypothetical protein